MLYVICSIMMHLPLCRVKYVGLLHNHTPSHIVHCIVVFGYEKPENNHSLVIDGNKLLPKDTYTF